MNKGNCPFDEDPNVMVLTTKKIINKQEEIRTVYHDADDGMWQFLDGTDINEDTMAIVGLTEVIGIDKTVVEVNDLPLGWVAWREEKGKPWYRKCEQ